MYINFVDFSSAYCGTNQREKKIKMKVPYKIGLDKFSMVFWQSLLPVVTSYYIEFFRVFLGI